MKNLAALLLWCSVAHGALSVRSDWSLASGADDLVQSGNWACVAQVSLSNNVITVSAGNDFNTAINTSGVSLKVNGDFSVMATLNTTAGSGASLTLVGKLNQGQWWEGLNRLDVGVGGSVLAQYWDGSSPTPTQRNFATPPGTSGATNLEVARIGSQIVIFINGTEAGRFADPGAFQSGNVYFGFNVAPGATLQVTALAAAVPSANPGNVTVAANYLQTIPRNGDGLRDHAERSGFLIGGAIAPSLFSNINYATATGKEFNAVVAENVMKFGPIHPARNTYSFCQPDQLVAFAKANNMLVRGHTMVWHQQLANWLTNGNFSAAEAETILRDHIYTVAGRYKGKVLWWDVVNEAINDGSVNDLRAGYWLNTIGPSYIDKAFQWTNEADPTAKLFYNDYSGEGLNSKSNAIYNLVKGLQDRGVPIHGVGLQAHFTLNPPSKADISANIKRLGDLGLEVHITELDVRIPEPPSGAQLQTQATIYGNVMSACLENSNCTAVMTWGVSDANSWIPGSFPGFGSGLLLDSQFQKKPAYNAVSTVMSAIATRPQIYHGGVVIHAGYTSEISPGAIVDIYGKYLSAAPLSAPGAAALLPKTLGGTQVLVNGVAAPLIFVSPDQVIFQMPYETSTGTAKIVVTSQAMQTTSENVLVKIAAPSVLTFNGDRAVAVNENGQINTQANPAKTGTYIVLYAIGSGPVAPALASGAFAPNAPLSSATLPVVVMVGDKPVQPYFAGMAPGFAGLMQVNVQIPQLISGDYDLKLIVGGNESNVTRISVVQ